MRIIEIICYNMRYRESGGAGQESVESEVRSPILIGEEQQPARLRRRLRIDFCPLQSMMVTRLLIAFLELNEPEITLALQIQSTAHKIGIACCIYSSLTFSPTLEYDAGLRQHLKQAGNGNVQTPLVVTLR